MKPLKILFFMVMMLAFATAAMAVNVNIRIDDGTPADFTLSSMQVGQNGDITLSVISGNPPSTLTLGLAPNSLPSGTINTAYSQTVTMSALNGVTPYTFDCSGSGITGITAHISGTNQCVISGTPTATGNYTVNFSVVDSTTPTALTDSESRTFSVNSPNNAIDIGGPLPNKLDQTIDPNSAKYYFFKLDKDYDDVKMYMLRFWTSGVAHMVLSRTSQPGCEVINGLPVGSRSNGTNGYWYNLTSGSTGETVNMFNIAAHTGDVIYVTVCDNTNSSDKYTLYWSAGTW